MSAAPFDILQYFDPDGDEPELHEVFVQGADPDPGGWIEISGERRRLHATALVLLLQRGARRIAVQHGERIVEFDLRDVILCADPLTGFERT